MVDHTPIRILMVVDDFLRSDSIGGGDVSSQIIRAGFKKRGHNVAVACNWRIDQEFEAKDDVYRIFTPRQVWKNASPLKMVWIIINDWLRMWKLFKLFRPHVLYCLHQSGISVPLVSAINSSRIPKMYRFGYEWPRLYYVPERCPWYSLCAHKRFGGFTSSLLNILQRVSLFRSFIEPKQLTVRFAVHNSYDMMNRTMHNMRGAVHHEVLRNCVDLDQFIRSSNQTMRDERDIRLLYVGRLVKHKGVHILIEAMPAIARRFRGKNRVFLTIVGSSTNSNYIECLKDNVKKLGIENFVSFVGPVRHRNLPLYYHSHDILVFPSVKRDAAITVEGCPSVLLEAMAASIPIVARIGEGVEEVVKDGITCVGVYSDNSDSLANAIVQLWEDVALRERLIKNGIHQVLKEHNINNVIERTETLLKKAIEYQ